jgi:hypothetical protein
MLTISGVLLTVDGLEIHQLIQGWNKELHRGPHLFEACLKTDILTRLTISFFSMASAISAFVLTLMLIISIEYFMEKLLSTYLYFNYMVFGPIMLSLCIIGIYNCQSVFYMCINKSISSRVLSISNVVSVFGGLILSLLITVTVAVFKGINSFIDSTTRKPEGNSLIRKAFWYFVFKNREPAELLRDRQAPSRFDNSRDNSVRINI